MYCIFDKISDLGLNSNEFSPFQATKQPLWHFVAATLALPQVGPTENQQRALTAREKVRLAVINLSKQNLLPSGATKRFDLLCAHHVAGGSTLYINRDLWHPQYIGKQQRLALEIKTEAACAVGAAASEKVTSLLGSTARNKPYDRGSSDSVCHENDQKYETARNLPSDGALSVVEAAAESVVERSPAPKQLALNIQWALEVVQRNQQAQIEAKQQQYQQQQQRQRRTEYEARLRQWVDSGDPVLVAEAQQILSRLASSAGTTQGSG